MLSAEALFNIQNIMHSYIEVISLRNNAVTKVKCKEFFPIDFLVEHQDKDIGSRNIRIYEQLIRNFLFEKLRTYMLDSIQRIIVESNMNLISFYSTADSRHSLTVNLQDFFSDS